MRILFIVWDLSKGNDANINITKILANELITSGNEVYMIGKGNSNSITQTSSFSNINYKIIESNEFIKKKPVINNILNLANKKVRFLGKLYKVISNIQSYLNVKINQKELLKTYVKSIEELCESEKIDVAIAVSFPFTTSIALSRIKIKGKKVVYQLDPHSSHYKNKKKRKRLKEEAKVINNVDLLLVTRLIFQENKSNKLSPYLEKMYPLDFPNIRPLIKTNSQNNIEFDKDFINCVFVGNLYKDIRDPIYLLKIFSGLSNKKIVLHCVGGGDIDQLYNFRETLGERIKIYGVVQHEKATNVLLDADILINIGNNIPNQMPSKIFDYISTGKPIINIYKLNNCPTLEYTKEYPLCLDIFEGDDLNNAIKQFEEFCVISKNRKIGYSTIKRLYSNHTVESVSKEFKNKLYEIVEKGE